MGIGTAVTMNLEAGKRYKIEITGIDMPTDLADLKDDYEEYNVKISAAKKLKLHITLLDSEGEEVDDSSTEMYVVKCGRDWCLDVNSMGNIF